MKVYYFYRGQYRYNFFKLMLNVILSQSCSHPSTTGSPMSQYSLRYTFFRLFFPIPFSASSLRTRIPAQLVILLRTCAVDGEWLQWQAWAECSVSCGGGTRHRLRTCKQPLHGGLVCDGTDKETEACNQHLCPSGCFNISLCLTCCFFFCFTFF